MNIIQSLWTLPMLKGRYSNHENRFHGGWSDLRYHLMSLAYSCLQLRQFYNSLSLITDEIGNDILINKLGLPYTRVTIKLDKLNEFDPELWALGKIYAYSIQDEPFLHVDGDVFIWDAFPEKFETADLVAQNFEHNFRYYTTLFDELVKKDCYIPEVVSRVTSLENEVNAFNAGVFGGSNIPFFKMFTAEAGRFIQNNIDRLHELPVGKLNAFFEQHLFYCMSKEQRLKVHCITDIVDQKKVDYMLKSLPQFLKASRGVNYIHLFGGDAKNDPATCNHLETLLKQGYPEYHQRVLDVCNSGFMNTLTHKEMYTNSDTAI